MNEELEKEAKKYARKEVYYGAYVDEEAGMEIAEEAYLAGAEPREKRIAELEAQIEKMKCCGNCIHCKYDENEESYEWCEVHDQVVNIAIKPCYAYEMFDLDKALKEIKEK